MQIAAAAAVFLMTGILIGAEKPMQKMVFDEKQIEGKIRRPQLVLIKADQRPQFAPMVMIATDPTPGDHAGPAVDAEPYAGPFKIDEGGVRGIVP